MRRGFSFCLGVLCRDQGKKFPGLYHHQFGFFWNSHSSLPCAIPSYSSMQWFFGGSFFFIWFSIFITLCHQPWSIELKLGGSQGDILPLCRGKKKEGLMITKFNDEMEHIIAIAQLVMKGRCIHEQRGHKNIFKKRWCAILLSGLLHVVSCILGYFFMTEYHVAVISHVLPPKIFYAPPWCSLLSHRYKYNE